MKRRKNNNNILSSNIVALISAIVIVIGLFLIFYNFINKKRLVAYDYINEQLNTNVEVKNIKDGKITYDFWKVSYHDINFEELNEK